MKCRIRARAALVAAVIAPAAVLSPAASAANLPEIKISADNVVPQCATPGRLMAFIESRNGRLDSRFKTIAADYMRIGEELNVRWDTALFQMLLETGNLTFKGDVSVSQNNFAGLGATGRGAPGESFPDVPTGVKAHLQHLLMYAGETIAEPVAERTRKVQEWGVLTKWQQSVSGPMTYALIARQWAPGSRNYARDIAGVADAFYDGACNGDDPKPELMALARPNTKIAGAEPAADVDAADVTGAIAPKLTGAELARRAVQEARASGSFVRSNLGAASLADESAATQPAAASAPPGPTFKILNAAQPEATVADASPGNAKAAAQVASPAAQMPASARVDVAALSVGSAKSAAKSPAATAKQPPVSKSMAGKCKVWTASYGGGRAVIIKARADQLDNYTVLDVNEGAEKREADAYIAAYAKGGKTVGEFQNPSQALDKAFELCPEG